MQRENTKKADLVEGEFYAWDRWKRRDNSYSTYSPYEKVKLISKTAKSFQGYGNAPTMVVIEFDDTRTVKNPNEDWREWREQGSPEPSPIAPYLYDENGKRLTEPYKAQKSVNVWELLVGDFETVELERIEAKRRYEEAEAIRQTKREEKDKLSKEMISEFAEVRKYFGLNTWNNGLTLHDNDTFDKERRILEILRQAMEAEKNG